MDIMKKWDDIRLNDRKDENYYEEWNGKKIWLAVDTTDIPVNYSLRWDVPRNLVWSIKKKSSIFCKS